MYVHQFQQKILFCHEKYTQVFSVVKNLFSAIIGAGCRQLKQTKKPYPKTVMLLIFTNVLYPNEKQKQSERKAHQLSLNSLTSVHISMCKK